MTNRTADPVDLKSPEIDTEALPPKVLTPQAQRALAEADERRAAREANRQEPVKEFQGPKGPEPTRYGDWETKGITSDF